MVKTKIKNNNLLMITSAIVWLVVVSFITAQTEYQNLLADRLADPNGTSTQLERVLRVVFVVISFMPGGFLLAYLYVRNNFKRHKILLTILSALLLSVILYFPFGFYNFLVNYGR